MFTARATACRATCLSPWADARSGRVSTYSAVIVASPAYQVLCFRIDGLELAMADFVGTEFTAHQLHKLVFQS